MFCLKKEPDHALVERCEARFIELFPTEHANYGYTMLDMARLQHRLQAAIGAGELGRIDEVSSEMEQHITKYLKQQTRDELERDFQAELEDEEVTRDQM